MTPARTNCERSAEEARAFGAAGRAGALDGGALSGGIFVMVRPAAEDRFIRSRFVAREIRRHLENPSVPKTFSHRSFLEAFCVFVRDIAFDVS